jgi:hypothetical protein
MRRRDDPGPLRIGVELGDVVKVRSFFLRFNPLGRFTFLCRRGLSGDRISARQNAFYSVSHPWRRCPAGLILGIWVCLLRELAYGWE